MLRSPTCRRIARVLLCEKSGRPAVADEGESGRGLCGTGVVRDKGQWEHSCGFRLRERCGLELNSNLTVGRD